jgi:hypothetical protein
VPSSPVCFPKDGDNDSRVIKRRRWKLCSLVEVESLGHLWAVVFLAQRTDSIDIVPGYRVGIQIK